MVVTSLLLRCSLQSVSGGGTEGGNTVCGMVANDDETVPVNAKVNLIPHDYNPGLPGSDTSVITTTTDDDGSYSFEHATNGAYTIEVIDTANGKRTLITGILISGTDIIVPVDTLRDPGAMLIHFPANTNTGYVYVPGTTIYAPVSAGSELVVVNTLPAKHLSSLCYVIQSEQVPIVLRYDIQVISSDTVVIANTQWKYAREIYLNTTATGAAVSKDVTGFPVAIRLIDNNFDFSQAKAGGGDIRFVRSDSTFLPYEIERWNMTKNQAEIWVKVDTVRGNDSTQYITMYWGNLYATNNSNSSMVFDTASGFQGVWHMNQEGSTTAFDATANHFNGNPIGMNAASSVEGMIGGCQKFDGSSSYFSLSGTAEGKLNFPQNGTYSLSAWVYADTLDSSGHYVLSKSDRSYNLDLSGFNKWEVYDVVDGSGLQSIYTQPATKCWKYLTGVRKGKSMYLYVDGVCMDSNMVIKKSVVRNDSYEVQIGKRSESDYGYWKGMLDEVSITSVSLSPDWIKLCYMNQREDDKLVVFK
jgi:hypothetical protein